MPFRYACFISYRHGEQPGTQRLYDAFEEELAHQVELYLPKLGVYRDQSRLRGGDFFNQELADALCSSVCMVMLFIPFYFDPEHAYCAREYQAMVELERTRLSLLPPDQRTHGLIIPIVLRGEPPDEVRSKRHCYSLDSDLLTARDFRKQRPRQTLRQVAGDIYRRHEVFRAAALDPGGLCDGFDLPSEADVRPLLDAVTAIPAGMPFR